MKPKFSDHRKNLLDGLRAKGWTVADGLKVPHATSPNGEARVWFKTQSVHLNDTGTDPRSFANTHSLTSDIREIPDADCLELGVARSWAYDRKHPLGM